MSEVLTNMAAILKMEVPADEKSKEPAACQSFTAGDVILSCEPWVCAFQYQEYKRLCAYCFKEPWPGGHLLRCSRCQLHHYCGRECQIAHWKMEHKSECDMLKEMNANIQQQLGRNMLNDFFGICTGEILMAKIVNKIEIDKNKKLAGISQFGASDVLEMLPYDPRFESRYEEWDHSLHALIWPTTTLGSIPGDFHQLAQKVYYNASRIWNQMDKDSGEPLGAGLFLSALHRRMTPVCLGINVTMDLQGRTMVVQATEDIPNYTGLKDLRQNDHSANLFPVSLHEREMWFEDTHFDPCRCSKCTEEFDAEINPLKCISNGCTERIPSDDRALQPCAQCGAINDQRLWTLKDLIRKNFAAEFALKNTDQRAQLQHALLLELDHIVHPDAHFRYVCGSKALGFLSKEQRFEEMWNVSRGLIPCVRAIYPKYHLGRACFLRQAGEVPWAWYCDGDKEGLLAQWKEFLGAGVMDWLWEAREIYRKLAGPDCLSVRSLTIVLQAMCVITEDEAMGDIKLIKTDLPDLVEFCRLNMRSQ